MVIIHFWFNELIWFKPGFRQTKDMEKSNNQKDAK